MVGPSSSHTIGPMKAGHHFAETCAALPRDLLVRAVRFRVRLYGSLSATGTGHGTDAAVVAGLPFRASTTAKLALHGSPGAPSDDVFGTDRAIIDRLPGAGRRVHPAFMLSEAEVRHGARSEQARAVDDLLARRHRALFIDAAAGILDQPITPEGAYELAKCSRGTPRVANRFLKRVRDFAQVKYDGRITKEVASFALDLLEVDRYGLDQTDRLLLTTIMEKFQGGPVGLDTLAASIGEDAGTIEDVYEPFLIKSGFINRTPRGRVATEFAWHHLGLEAPRKIEE